MDSLQGASKKWKRYYAISTDWISSWLRYAESADKSDSNHPGPVDNDNIMRSLCSMEEGEERKDPRAEFYSISKHLFYFFVALYGGGPAVVLRESWELYEPVLAAVRTETAPR